MPIVSLFDRALPTSSSFKQSNNIHIQQVNVYIHMAHMSHLIFCPFFCSYCILISFVVRECLAKDLSFVIGSFRMLYRVSF
jgi:coproporphyrinogen III oxidase-like Fe-S oxidoreductase